MVGDIGYVLPLRPGNTSDRSRHWLSSATSIIDNILSDKMDNIIFSEEMSGIECFKQERMI